LEEAIDVAGTILKSRLLLDNKTDPAALAKIFCYDGKAMMAKAAADPVLKMLVTDPSKRPLLSVLFTDKSSATPTGTTESNEALQRAMLGAAYPNSSSFSPPSRKDANSRISDESPPPGMGIDSLSWTFFKREMNRMSAEEWAPWSTMTLKRQCEEFFRFVLSPYGLRVQKNPKWWESQVDSDFKVSRTRAREDPVLREMRPELLNLWFRKD